MGAEQEESGVSYQFTKQQTRRGRKDRRDAVSIGVQDESNTLDLPIGKALLEWHAQPLEACASDLNVVYGNRDVTESARLGITRMVGRLVEGLRAMIVGKLEYAWMK